MPSPDQPPHQPHQRYQPYQPHQPPRRPAAGRGRALGLPPVAVIGLALIAAPRVVLHDLDIIEEGTPVNALLVFGPPVIWVAVAWWRRVANPFLTLLAVGLAYGMLLALGHQLFWERSFGDDPPALGGNLSDLDPTAQTVILRVFAVSSSLFTGVLVGAVSGLVARGLAQLTASVSRTR
ncbi:hypothetical protein [Streptomyces sp. MP131-18]|uniref:hypothetical protein n=1 Tax=Streptomyces sp. MP131-18 TaxID=1857892 RepID=UPI0009C56079|nr:hypothetical protein [Streptomyces sp. MP131-18]ONK14406.1 hypothetical protein STBA_51910 [Streptomyces sp. MP131-18]